MSQHQTADCSQRNERDLDLIRSIQAGDSGGLDRLLQLYTPGLSRIAVSYLDSGDLAQDVIQDVFISLWERRAELDIKGSVAGYLYRAVTNRSRDVLRRERTQRNIEYRVVESYDGEEPHTYNDAEQNLEAAELQDMITSELQKISPRTREIFMMRIDLGMTYEQIAETLGIGVPTVYTQMYRATKLLAKGLGKWIGGVDG